MKKIIAMLLCVAMVATLGINALAEVKTVGVQVEGVSTVAELLEAKVDGNVTLPKTPLSEYAKTLKEMNKELAKAKKIFAAAVEDAKKSYAVAQAYVLAAAYEAAWADLQIETAKAINESIAEALYEIGWETTTNLDFSGITVVVPEE